MTEQCKKCRGAMNKVRTIIGGNSQFDTYECEECGNEVQICRGVLN